MSDEPNPNAVSFPDAFKEAVQYETVRQNHEKFLAHKPSLKARLRSGSRFYGDSQDTINEGMIYRF